MIGNNSPSHLDEGPWKEISFEERIRVVEVENFDGFFQFVNRMGSGRSNDEHVWRGQRRAEWEVTSTLTRSGKCQYDHIHLRRFVRAIARCTNIEHDISENKPDTEANKARVWSLGQHHGLATPLIDFTIYPFSALFFAFVEPDDDENSKRAIFALDMGMIPGLNFEIVETQGIADFKKKLNSPPYSEEFRKLLSEYEGLHPQLAQMISAGALADVVKDRICLLEYDKFKKKQIKLHRPLANENQRLHSQGGLHVYPPNNASVESWIRNNHAACKLPHKMPLLTKILIPNRERESILTTLNRMGVNYLSIFPDLEGAAKHCNLALSQGFLGRIRDY